MTGSEPITPLNKGTSNQNTTKSIIEGHVSALKELLEEPSNHDLIKPMLLDFDDIQDVSDEDIEVNTKGKTKVGDEDLSKPFKEVLKCPFTRRIIEFSSPGHRMPANAKVMFQQTLDGKARAGFDKLPPSSIDNWGDLQKKFLNRFGMLKACAKDPTEISKIIRRANETLPNFKERWVSESNAIPNVPELMQILSFMSSHKCPELSNRFSDNIPKMVDEMLKRVDDYLRSEEAFCNIEFPKGEFQRKETPVQWGQRNDRHQRSLYGNHHRRQRGREGQRNNDPQKGKVINMVQCHSYDRKRKTTMIDEKVMNVPITFPPVLARDLSKEALVMEAEVEGYLVRRIHIDEGASVEIMFEHCFNMLHPATRARLVETQTTVSGFSGEQVKPLGKIELDMCFGGSGLCRRAIMKFTIIPEPSPYNIILGRPGIKQLRSISSTIHDMMKFPTPWGIATLVSQVPIVFECRRVGKKQALEPPAEIELQEKVVLTEQVLGAKKNHQALSQHQPIGDTGQSEEKNILFEKSQVIIKEVAEWLKAGIVRPVKYPTWISNPVLVNKVDRSWRMCIDFKNINATCPKDYYPLPEIDSKIESVMGFPLKCFLDAYKGYHQVQMADEDKKKTSFYTNLEGIRANPEKTKDIVEMQSPRTWGGMQSLAGKLAALNCFLSRSADKSLPFFETLKDITKENNDDYRWTERVENAFQELKKMILDLPALKTPLLKETLFIYLAVSREAVIVREGKQYPMH
ncbi:hypothetical protein Tco_1122084 [Tanacetum coccineum]|uniref:Reverse transcriptase domain-containing protein n=1 Tax=Tanacetum coccineum TaxID=301880 RepID=A0ABQ5J3A8_9ASTR